jgi:hypothetical protein
LVKKTKGILGVKRRRVYSYMVENYVEYGRHKALEDAIFISNMERFE